jgi:hypothetical protein
MNWFDYLMDICVALGCAFCVLLIRMMINNYFYFGDIVAFESRHVLKNELVRLPEGLIRAITVAVL